MAEHAVQVIAVTGGKGGIGKTNVSVNLAVAMAELGKRVVLLDADLGLANVDIMLGVVAKENLSHVLSGACGLSDILVDGPGGIKIVPATSGAQNMVQLNQAQHAGLVHSFEEMADEMDVLIIDTAAGISDTVTRFVSAAQEVLLVVCNEPTSITDAYAVIKLLNQDYQIEKFHIVPNMVRDQQEGKELFNKISKVSDRFLEVTLDYAYAIPYDDHVRKAVKKQRAVYEAYPKSAAAAAFKVLAQQIEHWSVPAMPRGNIEFFVEHLIQNAGMRME